MKIATYIIRFLLALLFIHAGTEKLFLPYDPAEFQTEIAGTDPLFFEFYALLHTAGYLYFVGFFQFVCGALNQNLLPKDKQADIMKRFETVEH